jgi:hypothetical protein
VCSYRVWTIALSTNGVMVAAPGAPAGPGGDGTGAGAGGAGAATDGCSSAAAPKPA